MFSKLGATVSKLLGEKNYGTKPSYFEQFYQTMTNFYRIADLFPYEHYNEQLQLFFNSDSCSFVLETPPLVGASVEMQKELSGLFQQLLPEESSLQVMLFADPHIGNLLDAWEQKRDKAMVDLASKRTAYLQQFAFKSPEQPYSLRNFRCFISFSQQFTNNEVILTNINQLKQQIITTLQMLGLPVVVWDATILINTLSSIINMDAELTKQHPKCWDLKQTINEQIANLGNSLTVSADAVTINSGKIKVRSYQARQLPVAWSLHAMGQLIGAEYRDQAQIPCPFILHYGVYIPKQAKPRTKVLTKASYVERQANSPVGKYLPTILQEAEELSLVREQLGRGERIVQTGFTVILLAEEKVLAYAEQILLNLYLSQEWQLQANNMFHLPSFLSCLPMMWGHKEVQGLLHYKQLKTTISSEAANLLPLQCEWRGTNTPGMLLAGKRGQIMSWYPFDNQTSNYNVCVIGSSGSGKSVFMQDLIATTLDLGGQVFVMDVGRSFEKTCLLRAGEFIEFKPTTSLCINPFSTIAANKEATQDALAMLKPVLSLMAAPTKGLTDLEASLLEQAMLEVFNRYQQDSNITLIADYLLKQPEQVAKNLGKMLFPFTAAGNCGRFFNGKANVDLNNPLIVVELEELKERKELQSVIVQMFIINITNKVFLGDRKRPFTIVFDEAWDLLRGAQSGVFIETLARRLRRYYGSLVVGTQSINDLFVNPAAQAAFDNSDWMCLLAQKAEAIEQLKKLGRISLTPLMEAQLKAVKTKHGKYSEVMIYSSQGYAVGRLLLDPYSLLLYSSKAEDYAAIAALRAKGHTLPQALNHLLTARGLCN